MKLKSYLSEGIGTFLLILIGCGSIAFGYDILTTAFAFGLIYFVLFYSFGNISGCHFNPIVSLAMLIQRRISGKDFFMYFLFQFLGGLLGALFLRIIVPTTFIPYNSFVTDYCCNGDLIAGLFVEMILSYVFVLTFIGANSKSRNKNIRGLIICAAMIIVCILGYILNYSIVNPIKALTTAIANNSWKGLIVFIIAPFIGSILATFHFDWFNKKEDENN